MTISRGKFSTSKKDHFGVDQFVWTKHKKALSQHPMLLDDVLTLSSTGISMSLGNTQIKMSELVQQRNPGGNGCSYRLLLMISLCVFLFLDYFLV